MPRRVEDIVRTDRRSIRETPADDGAQTKKGEAAKPKPEKTREVPIHRLKVTAPIHAGSSAAKEAEQNRPPAKKTKKSGGGGWLLTVVGVVAFVAIAGYIASIYFSRATFTVVPVTIDVPVDTTLVATGTSTPGYLSYKTISFPGSAQASVPASTGAVVVSKASGSILLSNTYSKDSQRLIAGTRLSSDSGLIYRLTGSVIVPGYTLLPTGGTKPGTISAPVIADDVGPQYNVSKGSGTTFKIVAYQGGPRYEGFTGRPVTDITGGYNGAKKTVNPTLLASTTADLQAALAAQLLAKAKASVPDGYIMYDSAYKASYSAPILSGTSTNSATVTLNGTLYAVIFKTSDLTSKIVGADKVSAFNSFPYRAPGLESLSFTITNMNDFSPSQNSTLIAHAKGDVKLIGIIPVDILKQKLAGLSLAQTSTILKSYSPIIDMSKSTGELFPAWSTSVPNDQSRISVIVKEK